ncbi:superoxide dismutase [Romboutsia sp.]|uniref:superoxide dismutase n=1 Tax=Romboutsia sp. TaxID=1965302 RepID=UPI002B7C08D1|nr:superoxide dismutase [Romboutsia sp.]HSQ88199.1 superoxide dismutase [Romboutsia sp.]
MKKKLLILSFSTLFIFYSMSSTFAWAPKYNPKELKPLPYDYDALEPYIDKETMTLHHDKHYKAYLDKFNDAIKGYPDLYGCSIYDLLTCLDCLPSEIAKTVKNNGGGVYNHEFFFDIMTPNKTKVSGDLEKAINRDFGSFDNFKDAFKKAGLSVFGSGWAWLVSNESGNLSIVTTANQDSPITLNLKPIIGIDVWEHAYYLSYKNNRGTYIDKWFNVINWDKAEENFKNPIK